MSDFIPAPPELRDEACRLAVELRNTARRTAEISRRFDDLGLLVRRQSMTELAEVLESLRKHRAGVDQLGKNLKQLRDDVAAALQKETNHD